MHVIFATGLMSDWPARWLACPFSYICAHVLIRSYARLSLENRIAILNNLCDIQFHQNKTFGAALRTKNKSGRLDFNSHGNKIFFFLSFLFLFFCTKRNDYMRVSVVLVFGRLSVVRCNAYSPCPTDMYRVTHIFSVERPSHGDRQTQNTVSTLDPS